MDSLVQNDAQQYFPGFPEEHKPYSNESREALYVEIEALLKVQNAALIAHYYTSEEVQIIADRSGGHVSDSLDMARFGAESEASTLIVAGVRFMGETAKILSPEKRVLMPNLEATCSLDLGCPIEAFSAFCDEHPDHTVVVYANTSAAVKARADWVVTSSCALEIVSHLKQQGKKILWAPDKHLGAYIQQRTGVEMLMWDGACIVHEEFKGLELAELKRQHPDARILAHPESPASVVGMADVVGSTSALIKAVKESAAKEFIVATDRGIFHKMHEVAPDKILIEAPTAGHSATCNSCAHCPWMAMNDLEALVKVLKTGIGAIQVDAELIPKAVKPIQRMLDFASAQNRAIWGNNDA